MAHVTQTIKTGDRVMYLAAGGRWRSVKVTSVTNQSNLILAIVSQNSTRTALNGGVAVPRRTAATQTNVWRPC